MNKPCTEVNWSLLVRKYLCYLRLFIHNERRKAEYIPSYISENNDYKNVFRCARYIFKFERGGN